MVLNTNRSLIEPVVAENLARRFKGVAISALDRKTLNELLETLGMKLWPLDAMEEAQVRGVLALINQSL